MKNPELVNFLGIVEHIIEGAQYTGSTRDLFKQALWAYEDEYGEPTEAKAQEFYDAFVDIMSDVATKKA